MNMHIIFFFCLSLISYTYFGYPLIIYTLSHFYKKPVLRHYPYPLVSVIISAYNEEKNIESKIRSLLELNYPAERLEILIGCDGSTDKTREIISRNANHMLKLITFPLRRGKPSVLNDLVSNEN